MLVVEKTMQNRKIERDGEGEEEIRLYGGYGEKGMRNKEQSKRKE